MKARHLPWRQRTTFSEECRNLEIQGGEDACGRTLGRPNQAQRMWRAIVTRPKKPVLSLRNCCTAQLARDGWPMCGNRGSRESGIPNVAAEVGLPLAGANSEASWPCYVGLAPLLWGDVRHKFRCSARGQARPGLRLPLAPTPTGWHATRLAEAQLRGVGDRATFRSNQEVAAAHFLTPSCSSRRQAVAVPGIYSRHGFLWLLKRPSTSPAAELRSGSGAPLTTLN